MITHTPKLAEKHQILKTSLKKTRCQPASHPPSQTNSQAASQPANQPASHPANHPASAGILYEKTHTKHDLRSENLEKMNTFAEASKSGPRGVSNRALRKHSKTHGKVIKIKILTELRRLNSQNFIEIIEVHDKTRIKSLSVPSAFLLRKHEKNCTFDYSNKALVELFDETRAKCNVTRISLGSIQNTRENMCKTQSEQQASPKTFENIKKT